MLRMTLVTLAVLVGMLALQVTDEAVADNVKTLKPGESYKGTLTEADEDYVDNWPGWNDSFTAKIRKIPIHLEEGESVTLEATVSGENRKVSLVLRDPTGKIIKASKRNEEVKKVTITASDLPVTGNYTILVLSTDIGGFNLTTTGSTSTTIPAKQQMGEKEIEEKIKSLKAEITELEKLLKERRAKKSK
jgi:hypothetical protein